MYSIGIAAERSGVTIETIRYYERESIVSKPDRTPAGRRIYTDEQIARLRFVKRCRDLGFPIPETKSLLGLTDAPNANCGEAQAMARGHLQLVQTRIADLKRMESTLQEMIEVCSDGAGACPLLDELLSG